MKERKKRVGRPLKIPKPGQRMGLGLIVTAEIKNRLDAAAQASGRTQSQEAELRLERSFEHQDMLGEALSLAFGSKPAGVVQAVARAMHDAGTTAAILARPTDRDASGNWINDPFAFQQARAAVISVLDAFKPEGDPAAPRMVPAVVVDVDALTNRPGRAEDAPDYSQIGEQKAAWIIDALASGKRGDDSTQWAAPLRELLGPTLIRRAADSVSKGR